MESLEDAVEVEKINKINKADFLSDVPANLRFKVTENIYDGVANKVLIFKDRDPDLVSNLIPKMTPMKIKKNEFVYKKGQFPTSIFLLFSGRVVEMDNGINFREYSVGSYFGETEILKNCPRKYSVKTLEDCQLMAIERNDLLNTAKYYPELKIDLLSCAIVKEIKTMQTLRKVDRPYPDRRPPQLDTSRRVLGHRRPGVQQERQRKDRGTLLLQQEEVRGLPQTKTEQQGLVPQ